MLDEIYNSRILEFAGNIPHLNRLADPDGTATAHSKLCGSTVTVDVTLDGDVISGFGHDVKACALGQASSSIMARHAVGATVEEIRGVRERMLGMLKHNGAPPDGKWADLKFLEPVRDFRARHASTMLTFDATLEAAEKALARQHQTAPV